MKLIFSKLSITRGAITEALIYSLEDARRTIVIIFIIYAYDYQKNVHAKFYIPTVFQI